MVVATLVSTILDLPKDWMAAESAADDAEDEADPYDLIEGFSDDQVYLNGERSRCVFELITDHTGRRVQDNSTARRRALAWSDR
jgi:hypothetical protein